MWMWQQIFWKKQKPKTKNRIENEICTFAIHMHTFLVDGILEIYNIHIHIQIQIQSAHVLNHRDKSKKVFFLIDEHFYITMCDHKFSSVKIKISKKQSCGHLHTLTHTLLCLFLSWSQTKNNNEDTWNQFYCRTYVKCAKQHQIISKPILLLRFSNKLPIQFSVKFVWPFVR